MKIPRWFAILAFAVAVMGFAGVSPSTAQANSLPPDPGVRLTCPPCTTTVLGPGQTTFSFFVPANAINDFSFINNTGFAAVALVLTTQTPGVGAFSCLDPTGGSYFALCTPLSNGVEFSGLDAFHPGIPTATSVSCNSSCTSSPFLSEFGIQVDNTNGVSFSMDGTLLVPEPSTILLLLVGLVPLSLLLWTGRIHNLGLKS